MDLDRAAFFARVRQSPFGGTLTQSQVDGMNAILDAAPDEMPAEHLAYCLATVFHETGRRMQPVHELGGDAYLAKYDTGKLAAALGNTPQADGDGQRYSGRGYVQITGRANYAKAGKALLADLIGNPDLAMKPAIAAGIMFRGMTEGWFTGKKLSDYFGPGKSDPVNARRVINADTNMVVPKQPDGGFTFGKQIAGYFAPFLVALQSAAAPAKPPVEPSSTPPKPAPQPATPKPQASWWDRFLMGLRGA